MFSKISRKKTSSDFWDISPVCQEAIWEAFRIFFDRVPNSEEYRAWVYTCQNENLCMDDLAQNFSSSQEHLDMVARVSPTLLKNFHHHVHFDVKMIRLSGCLLVNHQCKSDNWYLVSYFQRVAEQGEIEGYVQTFLNFVLNLSYLSVCAIITSMVQF